MRRLFVEVLEERSLLATTGFPTGEFGSPPDPRVAADYWEAVQLIRRGRTDELPSPVSPIFNPDAPGYLGDYEHFDGQFRLRSDIQFYVVTDTTSGQLSGLASVDNVYSPPLGPTPDDSLTWTHYYAWVDPANLDQILQMDGLAQINFPDRIAFNGGSAGVAGQETANRSAPLSRIDDNVSSALDSVRAARERGSPFDSKLVLGNNALEAIPFTVSKSGEVLVNIEFAPGDNAFVDLLKARGVNINRTFPQYGFADAYIDERTLTAFSGLDGLARVYLPVPFTMNVGSWLADSAGKKGSLTSRTDNDTGIVNIQQQHGLTVSSLVDLYWTGGRRLGMSVTLIANQVNGTANLTLDGGAGDILPSASTETIIDASTLAQQVADRFRNYGIDGTGVKVGVISDGINHLTDAINSTDLPSYLSDASHKLFAGSLTGTEGTAMLEIVHDVAPGAELFFSGATNTGEFLTSITNLVNAGVNIIVDDITPPGERYFMDSSVALAVANVLATTGVYYVTSANNFNFRHYQANASIGGSGRQDFDPGVGVDEALKITIPAGTVQSPAELNVYLQWSDPWGTSTNNYDLYLLDTNEVTVLKTSASNNGIPSEWVQFFNTGPQKTVSVRVTRASGVNRELELLVIGGSITEAYVSATSAVNQDALIAQEAVDGVIAVGAVSAGDTGNNDIELYSARGPSTIYTDFSTQTKTLRQSIDIVDLDGVDTLMSRSGWLPPFPIGSRFTGTSAAAPGIAGVLALMKQAAGANANGLTSMLDGVATDMGAAGYDNTWGFGRVNALEAVYRAFTPLAPTLDAASDDGQFNSDGVTSQTSLILRGTAPLGSTVGIFDNGVGPQATLSVDASGNYSFTQSVSTNSTHDFTVKVKSSSSSTNWSQASPPRRVYVDQLAIQNAPEKPSMDASTDTGVYNFDGYTTNTSPVMKGIARFQDPLSVAPFAFVELYVDGVIKTLGQADSQGNYGSLGTGSLSFGWHSVTVKTRMVLGAPSGSFYSSAPVNIWIDDGGVPVGTITPVTPDPRNSAPFSISWAFNRPIGGGELLRNGVHRNTPTAGGTFTIGSGATAASYSLTHILDATMAAGAWAYRFTTTGPYAGVSLASGVPIATDIQEDWTQGSGSAGFQNPLVYYDVVSTAGTYPPDGNIYPIDALAISNALGSNARCTGGPLPRGACGSAEAFGYIDIDGNNAVQPIDSIEVINYLNDLRYSRTPEGFAPLQGGGPVETDVPANVKATVKLKTTDLNGNPISTVNVGEQFQLQAVLALTATSGVQGFAGYADATFSPTLVAPKDNPADVGVLPEMVSGGTIEDAGRIFYGDATNLLFSKTFTATKKGTATFTADPTDLLGFDILVTGYHGPVPWSQVTFSSTTLTIKP